MGRRVRVLLVLLVAVAAVAGPTYLWYRSDRTRFMEPAALVQAAAGRRYRARNYRFSVLVENRASEFSYPRTELEGQYQQRPLLVALVGERVLGANRFPLAYFMEDRILYLREPGGGWLRDSHEDFLDHMRAYEPNGLAGPLVTGLVQASFAGVETLPGGAARVLDATVKRSALSPRTLAGDLPWDLSASDVVPVKLWVDKATLLPVQVVLTLLGQVDGRRVELVYRLAIKRANELGPASVPVQVRAMAVELGPHQH